MYTVDEFLAKADAGEFKIDTGGHQPRGLGRGANAKTLVQKLCERLRRTLLYYEEKLRASESSGEDASYYHKQLEGMRSKEFAKVGEISLYMMSYDFECSLCDTYFYVYLKTPDTIGVANFRKDDEASLEAVPDVCTFAKGVQPAVNRVELPSGKFLFANYFHANTDDGYLFPDAPPDMEYTSEYSLNTPLGRLGVSRHLAAQDVVYCQTGNMAVHFYQNPDKNEILVLDGEPSTFKWLIKDWERELSQCDADTPEEERLEMERMIALSRRKLKLIRGYTWLGSIDTPVWRIQGADLQVLEAAGFQKMAPEEMDYVEVELAPGTWEATEYFRSDFYEGIMFALRRVDQAKGVNDAGP